MERKAKLKSSVTEVLQKEVGELIRHTEEFSVLLKKLIQQKEVDIEMEREMTVKVLEVILQKWMVEIIHLLFIRESMRFNELKRSLRRISSRTLAADRKRRHLCKAQHAHNILLEDAGNAISKSFSSLASGNWHTALLFCQKHGSS